MQTAKKPARTKPVVLTQTQPERTVTKERTVQLSDDDATVTIVHTHYFGAHVPDCGRGSGYYGTHCQLKIRRRSQDDREYDSTYEGSSIIRQDERVLLLAIDPTSVGVKNRMRCGAQLSFERALRDSASHFCLAPPSNREYKRVSDYEKARREFVRTYSKQIGQFKLFKAKLKIALASTHVRPLIEKGLAALFGRLADAASKADKAEKAKAKKVKAKKAKQADAMSLPIVVAPSATQIVAPAAPVPPPAASVPLAPHPPDKQQTITPKPLRLGRDGRPSKYDADAALVCSVLRAKPGLTIQEIAAEMKSGGRIVPREYVRTIIYKLGDRLERLDLESGLAYRYAFAK